MPVFGDFESYGEPLALTEDRGHVTTVWRARRSGGKGDPDFAIKCYAPVGHGKAESHPDAPLAQDPTHEYLESVKQLKKAQVADARCLCPVHDFGISDEGAWFATDYYNRGALKTWISRRGGVDGAALRHVVRSVVTGCLTLKRTRGFSHGNLKPSNVLLVGKPRPLRLTPLCLVDAHPAASLRDSQLAQEDRGAVGGLWHQAVEVQDLRALGELLLQLVEGRLITSAYDYNYPIAAAPAWERLGKDGERWRELCNRLLDPRLSLDKLSLESLAVEFGSAGGGGGTGQWLKIAAILVAVCLLGGAAYGVKAWRDGRIKAIEAAYQAKLIVVKQLVDEKKFPEARENVIILLKQKPGDTAAKGLREQIDGQIESAFSSLISQGETDLRDKRLDAAQASLNSAIQLKAADPRAIGLSNQIVLERGKAIALAGVAEKQKQLARWLAEGKSHAENKSWRESSEVFTKALVLAKELSLVADEKTAQSGLDVANQKLAAMTADEKRRDSIRGWRDSAVQALKTNGWQQAVDSLKQAQAAATGLGDQTLLAGVNSELRNATNGLRVFLAEKEVRGAFSDLMREGARFEGMTNWPSASSSYTKALAQAKTLKDDGLIKTASNAFSRLDNLLRQQATTETSQRQIDALLASGTGAGSTQNWQQATNDLIQAIIKARAIKDATRTGKAEMALASVKKQEIDWSAKQGLKRECERWLADGATQAQSGQWPASSNSYAQAEIKARELGDRDLIKKATNGVATAKGGLMEEEGQTNLGNQVAGLIQQGDQAGLNPAATTNELAKAVARYEDAFNSGQKLKAPKLREEAENKLASTKRRLQERMNEAIETELMNKAFKSASRSFDEGAYEDALEDLKKATKHTEHDKLFGQIDGEQKAYLTVSNRLYKGEYSFISDIEKQTYANKPPFFALLDQGRIEERQLINLRSLTNQPNTWKQVQDKLKSSDAALFSKKDPFAKLAKWAAGEAESERKANERTIALLDDELAVWLRVFNIRLTGREETQWLAKKPAVRAALSERSEWYKSYNPDNKPAAKLDRRESVPAVEKQRIKPWLDALRGQYAAAGSLDTQREGLIDQIRRRIDAY